MKGQTIHGAVLMLALGDSMPWTCQYFKTHLEIIAQTSYFQVNG